ncbi:hypothetical protein [Pyruvatibacter sp.]
MRTSRHWAPRVSQKDSPFIRKVLKAKFEVAAADTLIAFGIDAEDIYESMSLPYIRPARKVNYKPDWPLPNGIIVETKGRFTAADRTKHQLVKRAHPHLDIRFIFYNNPEVTKLSKNSRTTVADWCRKNDIPFESAHGKDDAARRAKLKDILGRWHEEPPKPYILGNKESAHEDD